MALVVKDRVKETTSTTGTGTLTLGGAVTGFQTFTSVLSNSDTTYYAIFESSTGQFEVGLGTFTSSGTTLARTTILESSNSGNAINLTAGAADVFITQPAEKAVYLDSSGHIAAADGRNVTNVAASTAATLATARDIGGVSFNGSASINLPGVNTSGNQDTSGNATTATTAGTVTTAAQTNITSLGTLTTLTVDDITINGSTISDAADLTIDVGGDIILDADDNGNIQLHDGGLYYGLLREESNNFQLYSIVQDADMVFRGNNGGSNVTALTLDFSDAGTAIFNHDIKLADNGQLIIGSGSDANIRHDGSNTKFSHTGSGGLYIGADTLGLQNGANSENYLTASANGAVTLYHDNSAKLATTANGINVTGDVVVTNDIYVTDQIIHQGDSDTYLQFHNANEFRIVTGGTEMFEVNDSTVQLSAELHLGGNIINSVEDIYLRDKIYHEGDTDTYVGFDTNQINLVTGGTTTSFTNSGIFIADGSLAEDYDALSGTTPTCNVDNGGAFSLTMSGNTTFTFSGALSGYSQGFVLQLTGNGSTVTWPGTVDWAGGSAPDAPASGASNLYVFYTRDGGSNWIGVLSAAAYA